MQLLIIFSLWSSLLSYISSAWIFVTLISFSPFLICLAFCMMRFNFNYNYWKAFLFASRLLRTDRSSTFNVNIILFIFSWFAFSLVNCSLFYFYFWMIGWNFSFIEAAHLDKGVVIALTFMASYSIFILFSLFVTAFSFLFYSLLEITYAETLLERIKEVGTLRKIRGMIRE